MDDTIQNRKKLAKQISKHASYYRPKTMIAEYSVAELQEILERLQSNHNAKTNRKAMGVQR
jgi:hypothetical protein